MTYPALPAAPAGVGDPATAGFGQNTVALLALQRNAVRLKVSQRASTTYAANLSALTYDTVVTDTASGWNTATSTYVAQIAGWYQWYLASKQSTSAAAYWMTLVVSNPFNGQAQSVSTPNAIAANYTGLAMSGEIYLTVGATVRVANGGVAWTTQADAGADNNYLILRLVSA